MVASTLAIGKVIEVLNNFLFLSIYIGILAAMNERPSMALIISWIDVETLLLLFGMMILVAVLSETGAFDYLAVYAFKVTSWSLTFKN
jgi:Na+/H+ antiporter NhaD/arsenite permease-like protein